MAIITIRFKLKKVVIMLILLVWKRYHLFQVMLIIIIIIIIQIDFVTIVVVIIKGIINYHQKLEAIVDFMFIQRFASLKVIQENLYQRLLQPK